MCSSSFSSLLFFPSHNPSLLVRRRIAPSFLRNPRPAITVPSPRLYASLTESNLELSWSSPDQFANPEYGGWAIVDSSVHKKKTGPIPLLFLLFLKMYLLLFSKLRYFNMQACLHLWLAELGPHWLFYSLSLLTSRYQAEVLTRILVNSSWFCNLCCYFGSY